MNNPDPVIDVLCVGHACYDLIFTVSKHPGEDEKIFADSHISCGGGPAANAAVAVAQLGYCSAFSGYLGQDLYGDKHLEELHSFDVNSQFLMRGPSPTPVSTIIVKPDGKRALINYKGDTKILDSNSIDFTDAKPKVLLFDGHERNISLDLLEQATKYKIPTVLDAGSVHEGTLKLMDKVDYLACSEKFAIQYRQDIKQALGKMAEISPNVIITLGERGLIWQCGQERGQMDAFSINAVDTTGAGDAFHGGLSAALAANMPWLEALRYASATGALCCSKIGARLGMPTDEEVQALLLKRPFIREWK